MMQKFLLFSAITTLIVGMSVPKVVWLYWDKGIQNANIFAQFCYEKIKRLLIPTGWEIRMLTQLSLTNWFDDNEMTLFKNFKIKAKIPYYPSFSSDYLRLLVLKKYGGVYMDLSIILIQNLQWISTIQTNPHVFYKKGVPQVILFARGCPFASLEKIIDSVPYYISPQAESWFIAAIPNSRFIIDWIQSFESLMFKSQSESYVFLKQNNIKIGKDIIYLGRFTFLRLYLIIYIAFQNVIQKKQHELKKSGILDKLALQYYGVWIMNAQEGPMTIVPSGSPFERNLQNVRVLSSISQDQLIRQKGFFHYFVKLDHTHNTAVNQLLLTGSFTTNTVPMFSFASPTLLWPCFNNLYLVQHSFIYNHLIKGSSTEKTLSQYFTTNIPYFCTAIDKGFFRLAFVWTICSLIIAFITAKCIRICTLSNSKALEKQINRIQALIQQNKITQKITTVQQKELLCNSFSDFSLNKQKSDIVFSNNILECLKQQLLKMTQEKKNINVYFRYLKERIISIALTFIGIFYVSSQLVMVIYFKNQQIQGKVYSIMLLLIALVNFYIIRQKQEKGYLKWICKIGLLALMLLIQKETIKCLRKECIIDNVYYSFFVEYQISVKTTTQFIIEIWTFTQLISTTMQIC